MGDAEVLAVLLEIFHSGVIGLVEKAADRAGGLVDREGLPGDGEGKKDDNEKDDILLPGGNEDAKFRGSEGNVFLLGKRGEQTDTGFIEQVDEYMAGIGENKRGIPGGEFPHLKEKAQEEEWGEGQGYGKDSKNRMSDGAMPVLPLDIL